MAPSPSCSPQRAGEATKRMNTITRRIVSDDMNEHKESVVFSGEKKVQHDEIRRAACKYRRWSRQPWPIKDERENIKKEHGGYEIKKRLQRPSNGAQTEGEKERIYRKREKGTKQGARQKRELPGVRQGKNKAKVEGEGAAPSNNEEDKKATHRRNAKTRAMKRKGAHQR